MEGGILNGKSNRLQVTTDNNTGENDFVFLSISQVLHSDSTVAIISNLFCNLHN